MNPSLDIKTDPYSLNPKPYIISRTLNVIMDAPIVFNNLTQIFLTSFKNPIPMAYEHKNQDLIQTQTPPNRKTIFGKYQIDRLVGKGTFAKVYSAKNTVTGETVAVKVLSKSQVEKAGMIDQIQREISIMRLIRHPNVVELKEVMATRAKIYFVMEYVQGGELFAKVAKGRLKEEIARKFFQQLISAVDYCHSRGVSHRDLKLENLLLDEKGNLKVTDFGLSALPENLRHDGLLHTQCGTPAYVAPEVLKKKGYDGAKADVWSCGVILFVLVSGYLPFQDENLMKMYERMIRGDYKFPSWFPHQTRRIVGKLLVVDPNKRLTIQGIMSQPWFVKGFKPRLGFLSPNPNPNPNPTRVRLEQSTSPRFYNAFELISSMSSGFDLSSLFESKRRVGSMFTSKCSALSIVNNIEGLARKLNFELSAKGFKLKMQGRCEGRKGRLEVAAEVAAEVAVVEFSKCSGDTLEYVKFCEDDVRPALKDIVWTWQEDSYLFV